MNLYRRRYLKVLVGLKNSLAGVVIRHWVRDLGKPYLGFFRVGNVWIPENRTKKYNSNMKKLLILLLLSLGLTSVSYGGYYDDWPDDSICMWLERKPAHPGYLGEATKRGLNCAVGKVVTKAATRTDKVETAYQEMTNVQDSTPLKDNCSETIKKRVRAEEYLSESSSFAALKDHVIDVALRNAFQQVNGTEIRNFLSLDLSSKNGIESETFRKAITSKSAGLIDSYDIVDQEVLDLGSDTKVLSIVIDATVCVRDNALIKDVLLVGDVKYKKLFYHGLRSAIESVFSRESKSFELGYGKPSTSYYDILITGRIDNITKEIMVDKKAMEDARKAAQKQMDDIAGAAFLGSIIGAYANNNNNSSRAVFNSLSNNLQYNNQQQTQIRIPQITVGFVKVFVTVTANHRTNNRTYTATAVSKEEVAPYILRSTTIVYDANSLAIDALTKASKDLYVQLNSRSSN